MVEQEAPGQVGSSGEVGGALDRTSRSSSATGKKEAARFVWVCRGHLGNFENSVGVVRILKFKNLR